MSNLINKSTFTSQQIAFVDKLVDFFVRDGYVPAGALYESPFNQYHFGGPDELFGSTTGKLFGSTTGKLFDFIDMANGLAVNTVNVG